jgi:hypothetical protein
MDFSNHHSYSDFSFLLHIRVLGHTQSSEDTSELGFLLIVSYLQLTLLLAFESAGNFWNPSIPFHHVLAACSEALEKSLHCCRRRAVSLWC